MKRSELLKDIRRIGSKTFTVVFTKRGNGEKRVMTCIARYHKGIKGTGPTFYDAKSTPEDPVVSCYLMEHPTQTEPDEDKIRCFYVNDVEEYRSQKQRHIIED